MAPSYTLEHHQRALNLVSKQVKSFYERKIPFRIYHGSTNSTRPIKFDPDKIVDTNKLSHVLSIDIKRKVAMVEPNVSMDRLVKTTMRDGLVPPVVPEFPGITVGGSYSGTAGESSSFKYGYFDRTINWVEIVLANGDIVRASPNERSDLFYGAVGAFGTLGVTTLFEIQLVPAGKYVELTYFPVSSAEDALAVSKKCMAQDYDYVDGILFSQTLGAIIAGYRTNKRKHPVQRFTRARDPWFYLHAGDKVKKAQKTHNATRASNTRASASADSTQLHIASMTELVPLFDYIFRYDRGPFWMGTYNFLKFKVPLNRLTLCIFDSLLHTRKAYRRLHLTGQAQSFIIQDLALPYQSAKEFLEFVDRDLTLYPLWLCPVKGGSQAPLHNYKKNVDGDSLGVGDSPDMFMNVGMWGIPHGAAYFEATYDQFVDDNRKIERKVKELGGLKWLYAHNYYTEEEFWSIYDKEWYERQRDKWGAGTLPSLWDKMGGKSQTWVPTSPGKGFIKSLFKKDYLLSRKT